MFTKKFLNPEARFVILSFVIWRVALLIIAYVSTSYFSISQGYLGGGFENFIRAPWLWSWGNYDGVHYLEVASRGYSLGEQVYFPLYSVFIRIAGIFGKSNISQFVSALAISNTSFLLALYGLYKLVRLDYSRKVTRLTIVLLLAFPGSLFFASAYSESLFFCLVVWSFYAAKKEKWLVASLLAGFSSATRVLGILLLPLLGLEMVRSKLKRYWYLLLAPVGLISYMYFVFLTTGDPLSFIKLHAGLGEHRSVSPVLLPVVFYRYLFKILPSVSYTFFANVFATWFEFLVSAVVVVISIFSFKKLRLSYWLFMVFGFLIPTFSGSFSSMPRLVAVLFPAFIFTSQWMSGLNKSYRIVFVFTMALVSVLAVSLFTRGFWIA